MKQSPKTKYAITKYPCGIIFFINFTVKDFINRAIMAVFQTIFPDDKEYSVKT